MRAKKRKMLHLQSLPAPNAAGYLWSQLTSRHLLGGPSSVYGMFPSSCPNSPFIIRVRSASATSRGYFPSPPPSTDGIDVPSDDGSPELSPVHSTQPKTNEVLPSRKRCLSDADATGIPKRPHDLMAAPRFHTVSDPLPRSNMENESSIDDWFNTNFDALFAIPPPVDATEPDFSASWEVELFKDYSIPGNPKYAPKCQPTREYLHASTTL